MTDLKNRDDMNLLDRLLLWEKFRDNWQANIGRKSMFDMMDDCQEAAVLVQLQNLRIDAMKAELLEAAVDIERMRDEIKLYERFVSRSEGTHLFNHFKMQQTSDSEGVKSDD